MQYYHLNNFDAVVFLLQDSPINVDAHFKIPIIPIVSIPQVLSVPNPQLVTFPEKRRLRTRQRELSGIPCAGSDNLVEHSVPVELLVGFCR